MTQLLISLPEIAALAKVQRPVVSMWRSRFAAGDGAFPPAVRTQAGQDHFDAAEVADWLSSTKHGNNAQAVADLAAFAFPPAWNTEHAGHVDSLSALIALRVADGRSIGSGELDERAQAADPADLMLASEVHSRDLAIDWGSFVDRFIDAAYSPQGAWDKLAARVTIESSAGAVGPLSAEATDLLAQLALSIGGPERVSVVDAPGTLSAPELIAATAIQAGEGRDIEVYVSRENNCRSARRHLLVSGQGHVLSERPLAPGSPAVQMARLWGQDPASELSALEDLIVDLSEAQNAIVVGPASLLVDQLADASEQSRDAMLRSGRVRAIVRLGRGFVPTATRLSLALWVVGPAQFGVPIADRIAVVGALNENDVTPERLNDLVGDVIAGLGGAPTARRHSFRYLRVMRTSTLVAGGSLVLADTAVRQREPGAGAEVLPALIDEALLALGEGAPKIALFSSRTDGGHDTLPRVTVGRAISGREARVLGGARLRLGDTGATDGFPVLGRSEVRQGGASDRRIDRLQLLADYPRAELTFPGDVVFLAGAEPRAIVDHAGSSVVEFPARVLRLQGETLAPELAAADINAQPPHSAWRGWLLRRVAPGRKPGLTAAVAEIAAERRAAWQRVERLERLEQLVISAAAAGLIVADSRSFPIHEELPTTEGAE